jgi:GNAT acetyltransferase-like protein
MMIVETARNLFHVIDVFYPQPNEVEGLADALTLNQIVHIRQAPALLPVQRFMRSYRPFETLLLDLTRDIDGLFGESSRTNRSQVKKAERLRDRIEVRRNDATACCDFIALYNCLVAVKKHTERISKRRLDALKPFSDIFVAYFDGRPITSHVVIRDERMGRAGCLHSASTRFDGEDPPLRVASLNRWLHWYEMQLYKSEGLRIYDFGGIGTDTPERAGIAEFKLTFGGTRVFEYDYVIARLPGQAAVRALYALRRIRSEGWRKICTKGNLAELIQGPFASSRIENAPPPLTLALGDPPHMRRAQPVLANRPVGCVDSDGDGRRSDQTRPAGAARVIETVVA